MKRYIRLQLKYSILKKKWVRLELEKNTSFLYFVTFKEHQRVQAVSSAGSNA